MARRMKEKKGERVVRTWEGEGKQEWESERGNMKRIWVFYSYDYVVPTFHDCNWAKKRVQLKD